MSKSASIEHRRQQLIADYRLDGGRVAEFDRFTSLAAQLFQVPMAIVSVLGRTQQLFAGACGIDGSTPRASAFCNHTVEKGSLFLVEDARADPLLCNNDLVTGPPFVRFYAGAPILLKEDIAIGSLCLIDQQPRTLSVRGRRQLTDMASTVADLIELRLGSLLATEREEELRRQTRLLRVMVDNVDQGIAFFDNDLRLSMWNNNFFKLHSLPAELARVGLKAEEMLRESIRVGVFGDLSEEQLPVMMEDIRTAPQRTLELRTRGGRELCSIKTLLPNAEGFVVAVRDLTAERQAAQAKDEFVSTVSHELRTPLTSISGALALLEREAGKDLPPRADQMLEMARKNSNRLSALIDDMLDIERLGSGKASFLTLPVQLDQVAREAAEQMIPYAAGLDVTIALRMPGQPLRCTGDPGRINQVMTNLLSNAVKYTPAGGTVTVSAMVDGPDAVVEVRDAGPGVSAEFVPRLFERFTQAGETHRRGQAGTGLGLAITKAIVERHGGRVFYRANEGGGSCFGFTVPLTAGQS